MAQSRRRNYGTYKGGKPGYKPKRRTTATEVTRFAYNLGRVKAGLGNPDSKVAESFEAGKQSVNKPKRKAKTLF